VVPGVRQAIEAVHAKLLYLPLFFAQVRPDEAAIRRAQNIAPQGRRTLRRRPAEPHRRTSRCIPQWLFSAIRRNGIERKVTPSSTLSFAFTAGRGHAVRLITRRRQRANAHRFCGKRIWNPIPSNVGHP